MLFVLVFAIAHNKWLISICPHVKTGLWANALIFPCIPAAGAEISSSFGWLASPNEKLHHIWTCRNAQSWFTPSVNIWPHKINVRWGVWRRALVNVSCCCENSFSLLQPAAPGKHGTCLSSLQQLFRIFVYTAIKRRKRKVYRYSM